MRFLNYHMLAPLVLSLLLSISIFRCPQLMGQTDQLLSRMVTFDFQDDEGVTSKGRFKVVFLAMKSPNDKGMIFSDGLGQAATIDFTGASNPEIYMRFEGGIDFGDKKNHQLQIIRSQLSLPSNMKISGNHSSFNNQGILTLKKGTRMEEIRFRITGSGSGAMSVPIYFKRAGQKDFVYQLEFKQSFSVIGLPPAESSDKSEWKRTKKRNNITAYQQYISLYPDGRFVANAKQGIETLIKTKASQANTPQQIRTFVAEYPHSLHSAELKRKYRKKDDRFWKKALNRNEIAIYQEYLNKYPTSSANLPGGRHREEAISKIKSLETPVMASSATPEFSQEEQVWRRAQGNVERIRNYRRAFPKGKYAETAYRILTDSLPMERLLNRVDNQFELFFTYAEPPIVVDSISNNEEGKVKIGYLGPDSAGLVITIDDYQKHFFLIKDASGNDSTQVLIDVSNPPLRVEELSRIDLDTLIFNIKGGLAPYSVQFFKKGSDEMVYVQSMDNFDLKSNADGHLYKLTISDLGLEKGAYEYFVVDEQGLEKVSLGSLNIGGSFGLSTEKLWITGFGILGLFLLALLVVWFFRKKRTLQRIPRKREIVR